MGNYLLNVQSSGQWQIKITTMALLKTQAPVPVANPYSGHGNTAFKVRLAYSGLATFQITHNGQHYFGVVGYDQDGNYNQLWANEIGIYSGQKAGNVSAGDYYINVEADGDWTIQIIQ